MLDAVPRDIRNNVARARGFLQRGEAQRALRLMAEAVRRLADAPLGRGARAAIGEQIEAFLADLPRHPALARLLAPAAGGGAHALTLRCGKEAAMATVLQGLADILREEAEASVAEAVAERLERKKRLVSTGLEFLRQGQTGTGSAFLQRVVEEFGDEDGVCLQMGQLFAAANLWEAAGAAYERAMRSAPRDAAAYTGAVGAWLALGDCARAEAVYREALRHLGPHPVTLGRMAALYQRWGRPQDALDHARRALAADPGQEDALAVLRALAADGGATGGGRP